ncbi:Uracil phosphoribosyltransferase, partial [human gut metagenome]
MDLSSQWGILACGVRTGGSADAAITEMKKRGCHNIKLMVLVAAPEGIEHLQKVHPDVDIYAGAVDDHLNEMAISFPVWAMPATVSSAPSNRADLRRI